MAFAHWIDWGRTFAEAAESAAVLRETAAWLTEDAWWASCQLLLTLLVAGFAVVKSLAFQFGAVVSCLPACCLTLDPVYAGNLLPAGLVVTMKSPTCRCLEQASALESADAGCMESPLAAMLQSIPQCSHATYVMARQAP